MVMVNKKVKTGMAKFIKLPDGFLIEPLRKRVMEILKSKDSLLAQALGKNITPIFSQYLTDSLDRNENIILACAGRTRSGKSYAMLELSKTVAQYTGIPFTVNNICWHDSQFMSKVKEAKFKDWFLIDETEDSVYGLGSASEESYIEDFNRICAKKCINRVNVVGDYSTSNDKAIYKLISLARDFNRRVTRFILYSIEAGENLPLGYVDIFLNNIMCKKQKKINGLACINCPEYDTCEEFIAQYEKFKDGNIKRISEGGKGGVASTRNDEREIIALGIASNPDFSTCKNKDMRKAFIRMHMDKFSNRALNEGELRETSELAWWILNNSAFDMYIEKLGKEILKERGINIDVSKLYEDVEEDPDLDEKEHKKKKKRDSIVDEF